MVAPHNVEGKRCHRGEEKQIQEYFERNQRFSLQIGIHRLDVAVVFHKQIHASHHHINHDDGEAYFNHQVGNGHVVDNAGEVEELLIVEASGDKLGGLVGTHQGVHHPHSHTQKHCREQQQPRSAQMLTGGSDRNQEYVE